MRALLFALALAGCGSASPEQFERPDVIRFGATVAEVESGLTGLCTSQRTRRIDPPFLDRVQERQMQLDCDGFQFRGRGRHIEFVFRDDRLVMVWLMLSAEERDATIAAMSRTYGAPSARNANYVAFERHRMAWRFTPAEILFYAPSEDAGMAPYFE